MTEQEQTGNTILKETADRIRSILGTEIDSIKIEKVVIGLFFSGVKLSNGDAGVCFTPIKELPEAVCCPSSLRVMPDSGNLIGQPVSSYLNSPLDDGALRRAMTIATLNALSATCWHRLPPNSYTFERGGDPLDNMIIPGDASVVVVGALAPYIKMLIKRNQPFGILEKDPRTLKPAEMSYYIPPEKADERLASADWLIITGATLVNNTLEGLLAKARPGAEIILVGPTASMLPEAFFSRGIKAIGGITVTDADRLLSVISEAGSGYHFYGKSADRLVIRQGPRARTTGCDPCECGC